MPTNPNTPPLGDELCMASANSLN